MLAMAAVAAVAGGFVLGCADNGIGGAFGEIKAAKGELLGKNKCTSTETCDTVRLGGKVWMKKNLNIETTGSWCYGNNPANCDKYGRLYTWEAAKTACPLAGSEWRLPDTADWNRLESAVGGSSMAGKHLKSKTGWSAYSGIENLDTYGFSALPGGYRITDGSFYYAGDLGLWWTATAGGSGYAYGRGMVCSNDYLDESDDDVSVGLSVRCVGD
jgi:uncharacterized protein (TIGR02145 family)